ncbi:MULTISPECIES: hypothetical protein [Chromohalobacter]|uniref:hypothetical protein n=1 Tax=Chromohalobacter TaxID=42054 RepID=UPI001FFDBB41|nr:MULTISPECIES: hypothetical protein [Chromohalobacter]MCK2045597.1 hypothetical protein [Chromohalobacter moromii]MCT8468330.1 hypothetical protein [Chromohalobacter canadensis]MCT8471385.1 hypothetical protein [Chromohalobacter canadensis]MCT8498838.1 hypothetical protein [Chromohalobacter canadensis]
MKAKIGNLDVIDSQILLIPDGRDAWVKFTVLDWDVKLNIILEHDSERPDESWTDILPKNDHAKVILKNWIGNGMSFKAPLPFGETNGRSVNLLAFGSKVGNLTKVDLLVLLEAENEW